MMRSAKQAAEAWAAAARRAAEKYPTVHPLEALKERYVSGYDTLEQFERYVEQTLREGYSPNPRPEVET